MSRSYHLALPGWEGNPDEFHEAVVAALLDGPRHMKVALELWQLADRQDRVASIRAVLEVAHRREIPLLHAEEVRELDAFLDGLDEAVKMALSLDEHWQVPASGIEAVRERARLLNLKETSDQVAADGVAEGITEVYELRGFLRQAIDRGLDLVLD